MKHHYSTKNPELTSKALDFVFKYGRNTFDKMINELLENKKSPIAEGWIERIKK